MSLETMEDIRSTYSFTQWVPLHPGVALLPNVAMSCPFRGPKAEKSPRAQWALVLSIVQCPPDSGCVFSLIRLSVGADALWGAGILRQGEPAPRRAHTHPQPRTACASRETGR